MPRIRSPRRIRIAALVAVALMCAAPLASTVPAGASVTAANGNPFAAKTLYVNPNTTTTPGNSAVVASKSLTTNAADKYLASVPQAAWITSATPTSRVASVVSAYVGAATTAKKYPVLVLYAIPGRDCGKYSSGGITGSTPAAAGTAYQAWVAQVAAGIGTRAAAVIVEPDALTMPPVVNLSTGAHYGNAYCNMTTAEIWQRYKDLRAAVTTLAVHSATKVYLDAGNSSWWWGVQPGVTDYSAARAKEVARRLTWAGIVKARGFSVNVANTQTTAHEEAFAEAVVKNLSTMNDQDVTTLKSTSTSIGTKHYVVDTSRNGTGPNATSAWCNPSGVALGARPTTATSGAHDDAWLWIKHPGESDGDGGSTPAVCNYGPASSKWFQAAADQMYANYLAKVAPK